VVCRTLTHVPHQETIRGAVTDSRLLAAAALVFVACRQRQTAGWHVAVKGLVMHPWHPECPLVCSASLAGWLICHSWRHPQVAATPSSTSRLPHETRARLQIRIRRGSPLKVQMALPVHGAQVRS
jgi:hypothetical protein